MVFLKTLDVHEIVLYGKALREYFPVISLNKVFAVKRADLLEGDVVVSGDRENFSKQRQFDGDWHKVVAGIAMGLVGQGKSRRKRIRRRKKK